jgi:hypothetical protein
LPQWEAGFYPPEPAIETILYTFPDVSLYRYIGVDSGVRPTGAHVVEFDSNVYLDPTDGVGDTNAQHNNHQLEPQLTVGCMKCGLWISFALGALFIGGAKFYLDEQVTDF